MTKNLSSEEAKQLELGIAEALTIVVGLLAEATGSQKLAYHLGAALAAAEKKSANSVRDRLMDGPFRLVLMKAMRAAPDDPVLQDLAATLNARRTKH